MCVYQIFIISWPSAYDALPLWTLATLICFCLWKPKFQRVGGSCPEKEEFHLMKFSSISRVFLVWCSSCRFSCIIWNTSFTDFCDTILCVLGILFVLNYLFWLKWMGEELSWTDPVLFVPTLKYIFPLFPYIQAKWPSGEQDWTKLLQVFLQSTSLNQYRH